MRKEAHAKTKTAKPPMSHLKPASSLRASQVNEARQQIYDDVKKLVAEAYMDGKDQFQDFQDQLKLQANKVSKKINQKPLSAIAIAGGIGFVLALIFKK